jgi:integrase
LRAAQENVDKALPAVLPRQTVRPYLDRWLETTVKATVRRRTYDSYCQLAANHNIPALGHHQLTALAPQHVQEMLNEKSDAGPSPRTCQYIRAVLRRALNQAMKWGLVVRNAAALADPPKGKAREMVPFTPGQAKAFLRAIKGDRLEGLYVLALATGLRQGELLGLRWDDVDQDAGTMLVRRQVQRIGGALVLTDLKTEKSQRTLALPAFALAALKEHRVRQSEERLAAGHRWEDQDLVFPSSIGTPAEGSNILRQFYAHLDRAKLDRIRFHDLRHSAATFLLLQGFADRTVMEILGHTSLAMTSRYMHVLDGLKRDAADQMDRLFTGTGG